MSREIATELVGGPWDSRTGTLTIGDTPPTRLMFNLDDADAGPSLITAGADSVTGDLFAFYDLIDEKPRKVILIDDVDGHPRARSEKGVRYRYSTGSPCERLFEQARRDVLLTADARDQVMATRRLLLEEAAQRRERT